MNRIVHCLFLNKKSEGLDFQCYPGSLGKMIYKNISKIAWEQWKKKQTILINEKKLNMLNKSDQIFLERKMIDFLFKKQIKI